MNKKRFLKYYVIALFTLSFFFSIKNTYALDLKSVDIGANDISGYGYVGYGNYDTNVNFKSGWTNTYTFNSKNNVKDYDYLQFGFIIQYEKGQTYTEQTNDYDPQQSIEINCVEWEEKNQVYADNTTSKYYVCKKWVGDKESSFYTTSTSGTTKNVPDISIEIIAIFNDGTKSACELNNVSYGNTYATCKIPNSANTITSIQFRSTDASTWFNNTYGRMGMSNFYTIWKDPNSQIQSNTNQIQNNTNEIKNDIKSDDISGASSSADDLKYNQAFQDSTGLSGIVSMPLSIVNSFSNTCQPITLNFPYFENFQIPCIQSVISSKIPVLVNILKIVINGFLIYRVLLDIFSIVRSARNPDDDRIEVLDL